MRYSFSAVNHSVTTLFYPQILPKSHKKHQILSAFCKQIRNDLSSLGFDAEARPWAKQILAFYGMEKV